MRCPCHNRDHRNQGNSSSLNSPEAFEMIDQKANEHLHFGRSGKTGRVYLPASAS